MTIALLCRSRLRALAIGALLAAGMGLLSAQAPPGLSGDPVEDLLEQRRELDRTVWAPEVEAQRHEARFVRLWDDLLQAEDRLEVLAKVPFESLKIPAPASTEVLDLEIRRTRFGRPDRDLSRTEWTALLEGFAADGYRVVQTAWHHSRFEPASEGLPARSEIAAEIHAARDDPPHRVVLRATLHVAWSGSDDADGTPVPGAMAVTDLEVLDRRAPPAFHEVLAVDPPGRNTRLNPVLVYDLDGDGLSEVVVGGQNLVMRNRGGGSFEGERFLPHDAPLAGAGVLADFTGDGRVDYVSVDVSRYPLLFAGGPGGRFTDPGRRLVDIQFPQPMSFTAGDIDGDGDLDLFIANYKLAYEGGQMAAPYYDANDGYPASLLRNDGNGAFADVTDESGLGPKRFRRTYSSSFVDLDDDGDLDLIVVSDYAGLDMYLNDGRGRFTDVTGQLGRDRHLFGMSHTFGDYDLDGDTDLYTIGMSSTTARRLDRLGLGRDDKPALNAFRPVMTYGNRLFLREADGFRQAPFNDVVARTGWSWGATSFDVDSDGDRDIFVANGHVSGESSRDYCTIFWRHDIYTDDSSRDAVRESLFETVMRPLQSGRISWNGYEHDVLWLNQGGQGFVNVAFLLGVAFEHDGRAVVADDLDADGRVDLLAVELQVGGPAGPDRSVLHLYQNRLEEPHHWIGVRLHDSHGRSPIGATVTITSPGGRQIERVVTGDSYASQHPATVHFGLGETPAVEAVEVRWLDGTRRRIERPAVDQYLTVRPER